MATYAPNGQDLLVRGPFTQDFSSPRTKSSSYTVPDSAFSDVKGLREKSQPAKISFYTRNNPHTNRVRVMKGLCDVPICSVEDNLEQRVLFSPPSGQDLSSVYFPQGSSRYSANKMKPFPAIGVVPVTSAWRDELERMTNAALSKAMGIPPPSRGGRGSRPSTSQLGERPPHLRNLDDQQILDLLFRILHTDSVPACRAWLNNATENEKTVVLDLLNMAASREVKYTSRPGTSSNVRYSYWAPEDSVSRTRFHQRPRSRSYDAAMNDPAADFNLLPLPARETYSEQYATGGDDEHTHRHFHLPKNDTVVQASQQMPSLTARKGLKSSISCDSNLSGLGSRMRSRPPSGTLSVTGRPRSASVNSIAPFQHDALKLMTKVSNLGRRESPGIFLPKLSTREKTTYQL